MSHCEPNRWKGFVLGVVGAIPGMIAMDYFWKVVYSLQSSSSSSGGSESNQSSQASQSDQTSQSGSLLSRVSLPHRVNLSRVAAHT